jgi:hypothetical protein
VDSATTKIDDLTFAIILDAVNQEDNHDTETKNLQPEDQPEAKNVYQLLTYLCAIARGLGNAVPLGT